MNGFSLLLCWTLLGQVGSFGSNPNAPLGSSALGAAALGSASQAGTAPLGSAGIGRPSNMDASLDGDGKNYGWQINDLGELEYLIQISPSMLREMQDTVNKSELQSRIPRELVGRIKRVVVSIGNETLPRTPLSDVERLVPATASLPSGRLQNLESSSVVNVSNPASDNGFQSFNQSSPPTINGNNAATTPLGSAAFMDQARGGMQQPASGSLLDRFTGSGQAISSSRFNNTAGNANNTRPNAGGSAWNSSNGFSNSGFTNNGVSNGGLNSGYANGGYDRVADNRLGQSAGGYASSQDALGSSRWNDPSSLSTGTGAGFSTQNSYGQTGYSQNGTQQGVYAQGTYGQNGQIAPNGQIGYGQSGYASSGAYGPLRNDALGNGYNGAVNGQGLLANGTNRFNTLGNPSYANDTNLYNSNSGFANRNQGYGNNGFADSYGQYGGPLLDNRRQGNLADYQGLGQATGYLASTANNRSDLPSTSPYGQQANDRNLAAQGQRAGTPYRADLAGNPTYGQNYPAQDSNYFFYIFFILSIAINLWMVHLLRSLYLRYRSLLSSLRSQATTVS